MAAWPHFTLISLQCMSQSFTYLLTGKFHRALPNHGPQPVFHFSCNILSIECCSLSRFAVQEAKARQHLLNRQSEHPHLWGMNSCDFEVRGLPLYTTHAKEVTYLKAHALADSRPRAFFDSAF